MEVATILGTKGEGVVERRQDVIRRNRATAELADLWLRPETGIPAGEDAMAARTVQPLVPTADLERAGRGVRGVYACRVLRPDGQPVPDQVRVLVHGGRRLSVAKDIQSAWFALWGLYVPRRLFVVTGVRSPQDLAPAYRRPDIGRLRFDHDGDGVTAVVALHFAGAVREGRAVLPAPADGCRLAAEAVAAALRSLLPSTGLEVLDVRRLALGGRDAVAAALAAQGTLLMGIAPVAADPRESAARAVIEATDRLLRPVEGPLGRSPD